MRMNRKGAAAALAVMCMLAGCGGNNEEKVEAAREEQVYPEEKENAEYVRDVTWKRLEKDWGKETIEGLRNDIETLL